MTSALLRLNRCENNTDHPELRTPSKFEPGIPAPDWPRYETDPARVAACAPIQQSPPTAVGDCEYAKAPPLVAAVYRTTMERQFDPIEAWGRDLRPISPVPQLPPPSQWCRMVPLGSHLPYQLNHRLASQTSSGSIRDSRDVEKDFDTHIWNDSVSIVN